MKIHPISFLCIFLLISCQPNPEVTTSSDGSYLEAGFKNPPLDARPKALWDWVDGNFEKSEITRELEEAKAKGMAGFDIWDVWSVVDETDMMPDGPAFMSDEYVDGIVHAINEATRLDMELGLIIASGWNAGGSWVKPEHATIGQFRSAIEVSGPKKLNQQLPFPELPKEYGRWGKAIIPLADDNLPEIRGEIAVLATPVGDSTLVGDEIIDLSDKLQADGTLEWQVPAGNWEITRYIYTNTGQPMIAHTPNSYGPMLDHFNPEATTMHIKYFAEKLQEKVGSLEDKALRYFYTDSYEVRGDLWTPSMVDKFEERIGYSMIKYLPALQGKIVEDFETTERFLFDYKKLLSDLIIEGHYAKAAEICKDYGLMFSAEAGGPGPPVHNCPFESIKSSGALDIPRGEFWHNRKDKAGRKADQVQVIKGIACASHLYNRKYVEAEAFTSTQLWQEGPGDLKPTVDRFFCEGLNRIVFHTWPHTPEEAGKPGWHYAFGTVMNETRIWWPMASAFMDYLSRCSYMLQEGNFVGDVLYYYGDKAPNFVGVKKIDPSLGFGYDYDVTNSDILLQMEVKNGKLTLPHGQQYAVLVLPNEETADPKVLQKINELVKAGATVVGPKPSKSYSLHNAEKNDAKVKEIADKLWGDIDGKGVTENKVGKGMVVWGKQLRDVMLAKGIGPDLKIKGIDSTQIDFIHRKMDGDIDAYFISNKTKKPIAFEALFRINDKQPQLWNPVSGDIESQKIFAVQDEYTVIPINLQANGSQFVVFKDKLPAKYYTAIKQGDNQIFPRVNNSVITTPSNNDGKLLTFVTNKNEENKIRIKALPLQPIEGKWQVTFTDPWDEQFEAQFDSLFSYTEHPDHEIKFFSGIAAYQNEFSIPAKVNLNNYQISLNLGEVANVAEVKVNDYDVGILWHSPYRVDISEFVKPGINTIQVKVANLWPNRMIGDFQLPESERKVKSNVVRMPNGWSIPLEQLPNQEYGLLPSGLLGPVTISYKLKMDMQLTN
jgi:hypothetical protein